MRLVTDLAEQGSAPEALVLEVLAPAQREVGKRWEDGRWSVAQEHAATAVTDSALGLLALDAEPRGIGHAVVGCVEGEWHTLPARMAAEIFRLRGWDVTFLGPSLPADDLVRYLGTQHPDVVGLSCSMPVSLKGAARSIEAARAHGVPVLAGGSGFGPDGRYARVLGAAAWAPDPMAALCLLDQLPLSPPDVPPAAAVVGDAHVAVEREKSEIVSTVLAGLGCSTAAVQEAVGFLVAAVENALFVGDASLVVACRPAAERLLAAGNAHAPSIAVTLHEVLNAVERRVPRREPVLHESRRLLGTSGRPEGGPITPPC